MASSHPETSPGTVDRLSLTDNVKRHVITGIAFHNVLVPQLRGFVEHRIKELYPVLVQKYSINDSENYVPPPDELFFLNNPDLKNPAYSVKNYHELATLYLARHLKVDQISKMDSLAVLTIMIKASCFTEKEKELANELKDNLRNKWAHFHEKIWSEAQYETSFKLMELMVLEILPNTVVIPHDCFKMFC